MGGYSALRILRSLRPAAIVLLAGTIFALGQDTSPELIAQQILTERGYQIGIIDGVWGPRSAVAMAQLQESLGLPVTGTPDAATLEALTSSFRQAPVRTDSHVDAPAGRLVAAKSSSVIPRPTNTLGDAKLRSPATEQAPTRDLTATTLPTAIEDTPETSTFFLAIGGLVLLGALVIFILFYAIERRFRKKRSRSRGSTKTASKAFPSADRPPPAPSLLTPVAEPREILPGSSVEPKAVQSRGTPEISPVPATRPVWPKGSPVTRRPTDRSPWVPGGEIAAVKEYRLKGFIYVGESLRPQNGWGQRDNCLIVPSLPVAGRADVSGQYLDYWPSYERLSPSSRRAYLDWLASDRSDPETPIGYVFLYFYGIERRLMLDGAGDERSSLVAEVERLVGTYGGNGSFRRYSGELLSAARAMGNRTVSPEWPPLGLGDVPIADRIELGRVAAAGAPISPDLLLSLVANHPETRLRAPVRRLPDLVRQRFRERVDAEYPSGLSLNLTSQVPTLELTYRAASATFEVQVFGTEHRLPDVAKLTEPLAYGRSVLEAVTDELDGYSRELGRASATAPTIASLSKLPPELRHKQAAAVAGDAIAKLHAVADGRRLYRLGDLLGLVGLKTDGSTKSGLRDLSQCLAAWGIGIVPDPQFAPKIIAERDVVLAFRLDASDPAPTEPSNQYRLTYVSLALGLVVANADGSISDSERSTLSRLIDDAPDLAAQERRRLMSDFLWLEANPLAVSDLRQFLKQSNEEFRRSLLQRIIPVAAADGRVDAEEVSILERIAKVLELDKTTIYQALNSARPNGDDVAMVEVPRPSKSPAIPPPKQTHTKTSFDATRLAEIRAETAHASTLLSEIFSDETPEPAPIEAPREAEGGLDQRHRALLEELVTRSEWSEDEFERLVRQSGMMPGSVRATLNEWSMDQFDELILEGDRTIMINSNLILETT